MTTKATLIINGTLVDAHQQVNKQLLMLDGKIAQIADKITQYPSGTQIIDAKGMHVMPGGIDVHTHFNIDVGISRSCDDFYTGTRSAACGGTTTIIDHMGFGPRGCSLGHQLEVYKEYAKDRAVIDYSFHGVIQHVDDQVLEDMQAMVEQEGISSFKLYLTYGYKLDDDSALKALTRLNELNALTAVHPENDAAIAQRRAKLIKEGKTAPKYHGVSRPLECEAEAIARMINLASLAGDAPLYIVHLSNGLGLDYIRLAKNNKQAVWSETCPQYMLLDDSLYNDIDAVKYVMSPPLRPQAELEKLWQGVIDGSIDTIATDHCSFTYADQKQAGVTDFTKCPNGMPGVETRMPLMFSEGVSKGRISPEKFVELTSFKPAKLFGLYPQKGCLLEGSDADIVIFDPEQQVTISHSMLHDNTDYTPFENYPLTGWPVMTFSRGKLVARNGEFLGTAGAGQFLRRKQFDKNRLK
ncbi:dihydropyrimidinase [Shewanella eurypsychrophilus]|uniref:Dihydropyrimidinase n=1 Tax=Shewanella eurypsychrophilus TaxID=2593656 RepID=A0ABX6VBU6_9GAMM|nr:MULTISPECIES: dihydropyrimidinase [Shewanella]QFU22687.1 dihydropyrimidinase [Shewanella sp. YLB-09]QPG57976.1 dihydropyrimidinase [Shewanella eurypsychrophilus]